MVLACSVAGLACADDIALTGDGSLSGTIRSITQAGAVELASELSPEPVLLKAEAVKKVDFSPSKQVATPPGALVELVNGDLLPATIEALDDRNLTVETLDAGRLVLPRAALKSLQLGIRKRKVIYTGPRNSEEWTSDAEGVKNWTFENNALTANGAASASRQIFEMPQQFVFRFTLKWRGNPNLQVYFADPQKPKGEAVDRYCLRFNSAGMELKRETRTVDGNQSHHNSIFIAHRTPEDFPDNKLEVEVRVDRKASRVHLLLNGEPESEGIDPVKDAPDGKGVTIISNSSNGNVQEVRDIEILEFDDSKARHRSEQRGNAKTDSLISRDDDRWGGHLAEVKKTGEGLVFSFKSDFQETPLELLDSDVSTIFFAEVPGVKAPDEPYPFVLRLQENGLLHVTSCSFTESTVSAVHPLLGPLGIRRSGITTLERVVSKDKEEPEK